jgi:SAM-dependent methyltransferase
MTSWRRAASARTPDGVTDLHPAAATGFSRSADAYERGRPDYPAEAIDWLAGRLDLREGRTVLDLAAGTGKLTRALVRTGAEILAVEPLAEMRAAIGPPARVLDGTAEAIPLEAGSVDAVTVGQAFHWFDPEPALAEIHRVLRPGRALALVWNTRVLTEPVHAAIDALISPYRANAPAHQDGTWRVELERSPLFGPIEERTFANEQRLDADGLADRVGSISFVAALDAPDRGAILEQVRALAGDGTVALPYRTDVHVCFR